MRITFQNILIGQTFTYDGDTFVKTRDSIAWELRDGKRYKMWAFCSEDYCEVVTP